MNKEIIRLIKALVEMEDLLIEGLTDTQNEAWGKEVDEVLEALVSVRHLLRENEQD